MTEHMHIGPPNGGFTTPSVKQFMAKEQHGSFSFILKGSELERDQGPCKGQFVEMRPDGPHCVRCGQPWEPGHGAW